MTKSQHTPTPWKVHPYRYNHSPYNKGIDIGPGLRAVAAVIGEFEKPEAGPVAEANAAFIVRACNAHDALVEALDKANQRIEQLCSTVNTLSICAGGTPRKVTLGDWVDDIRAALKLAKEG